MGTTNTELTWQQLAALRTLEMADRPRDEDESFSGLPVECQREHLGVMAMDMMSMTDPAKVGRFLGWMQACVCIGAGYRVTDMMNLNRSTKAQVEKETEKAALQGDPWGSS